jgi:Cu/Ag efflux pump CusA
LKHEYFGSIYPASDWHVAAGSGIAAVWNSRLQFPAGGFAAAVDFPVISVGAQLPGADPQTMASAVATPLERQFGRISGVNQMTSSSQLGSTASRCNLI